MASEVGAEERAYPYWTGWHMVGCSVLFFGLFGGFAVSLLPAGYERVRTGDLPTGVAMMVMGVFGLPTLGMSLWSLVAGVRDTFRPPVLKLTTSELVLPVEARGQPPQDEYGEPVSEEPPHPAVLPLGAVRSVEIVGTPSKLALVVVHTLSKEPLRIERYMMRADDFEDLGKRLQAALPTSFTPT